MNDTIVYATKAGGLLLAYAVWALLVWHGNTPADGFVNGLLALIGFLTGNAVGKQGVLEGSGKSQENKGGSNEKVAQ